MLIVSKIVIVLVVVVSRVSSISRYRVSAVAENFKYFTLQLIPYNPFLPIWHLFSPPISSISRRYYYPSHYPLPSSLLFPSHFYLTFYSLQSFPTYLASVFPFTPQLPTPLCYCLPSHYFFLPLFSSLVTFIFHSIPYNLFLPIWHVFPFTARLRTLLWYDLSSHYTFSFLSLFVGHTANLATTQSASPPAAQSSLACPGECVSSCG